jgi:hypothetical protein
MREVKFFDRVQEANRLNKVWLPDDPLEDARTTRNWPLCLTCGREVEAVDLRNVSAGSVEIWASCSHRDKLSRPAEDYYRVVFPFRIDGDVLADGTANDFLKRAMHDFCPFPLSHRE